MFAVQASCPVEASIDECDDGLPYLAIQLTMWATVSVTPESRVGHFGVEFTSSAGQMQTMSGLTEAQALAAVLRYVY